MRMRMRPPYDPDVNRSTRVITGICINATDPGAAALLVRSVSVRVTSGGKDDAQADTLAQWFDVDSTCHCRGSCEPTLRIMFRDLSRSVCVVSISRSSALQTYC